MDSKIRVAFIKFGGLSAGGTEKWLQMMAANLPRNEFEVDYYYCDAAPYCKSSYKHADTDENRLKYMNDNNVTLIKFRVGFKDVSKYTHDWTDTDFWQLFDEKNYDLIQTAKAGPEEYPFYLINKPVVEYITLGTGVDFGKNIARSIHLSNWQRLRWFKKGGDIKKSSIIPIPVERPINNENLRKDLLIPDNAIVMGLHQRVDNEIYSEVPLNSYRQINSDNKYFIVMGGGDMYKEQAKKLGLKNVLFLKHSADPEKISKFLNTLDIYAHGRKDGETFGTVLAEAMIHGLPCLSHSSEVANAQPETMGPGGFFAKDQNEYTDLLQKLFSDEKLRIETGNSGKKYAEENYLLDVCLKKLLDIYKYVLNKNKIIPEDKFLFKGSVILKIKRAILRNIVYRKIKMLAYEKIFNTKQLIKKYVKPNNS